MPERGKTLPGWKRIAGRRYINLETGEELSRRQYEKLPGGLLARGGFTSFEAKAKISPKELRESRPARGRARRATQLDLSRIRPLQGHVGRSVGFPVFISVVDGALDYDEAAEYEMEYEEYRYQILRNTAIHFVSLVVETDIGFLTVVPAIRRKELFTYDRFLDRLDELVQGRTYHLTQVISIIFHFRFPSKFYRPPPKYTTLRKRR